MRDVRWTHTYGFAIAVLMLGAAPPAMAAPEPGQDACRGIQGYASGFEGRRTFLWRPADLMAAKAQVREGAGSLPAYTELLREADRAMALGPWTVVDKTRVPPSGDIHDYASMGPYWWPDPGSPNGEPYIRKDGETNPERNGSNFDRADLGEMSAAVEALALAHYFTEDAKYAERAALVLRTWFLDPSTRMNPNLNHGQGVPGVIPGRPEGIIDTHQWVRLVESIGLLEPTGVLTKTDVSGLRGWFSAYLHWLTTSGLGKAERNKANNHALAYDLQVISFALFSGNEALAARTVGEFPKRRISGQMALDGSLPEELARTRSFHYSTAAMSEVYEVAAMGSCVGIDIWSYADQEGRSIGKATDFLAGYFGRENAWKWQEISMVKQDLFAALARAAVGIDDRNLRSKVAAMAKLYPNARENLILRSNDAAGGN